MNKIVRLGITRECGQPCSVFAKIEIKDGKLSICGVVGPERNGDAAGGCGQIEMSRPEIEELAPGWTRRMLAQFWDVWGKWHLNDMRLGCKHQRKEWDTSKELELQPLDWGDTYHNKRQRAEAGTMGADEYATWPETVKLVKRLTLGLGKNPKHPSLWGEDGQRALAAGLVKLGKPEKKTAGWVYPPEHPDGLLCKPCPACGHKYGSAWLREELPADVVAFLGGLPDTDQAPAWV